MNKIVHMQYPVERLPDDLRPSNVASGLVTVTVEASTTPPMTAKDWLNSLRNRSQNSNHGSTADAVARIRKLRDEWDD